MTQSSTVLSSESARWYIIGLAAAISDLLLNCNVTFTLPILHFSLEVPYLISLSLAAFIATLVIARQREVSVRATILGITTGLGFRIVVAGHSSYRGFGLYMLFLSWFHFSEYFFTETYNPKRVKLSSFMLNHSVAYHVALACSLVEFFVEKFFLPGLKEYTVFVVGGSILCVFGELMRKRAMCVAGPNFNHVIQRDLQKEKHTLITHDIYQYIQHPSYTGWFTFTIGTQVALCNPLCTLVFPYIMYRFFEERVRCEEPALERKHKEKYELYKKSTPRFIPGVW